MGIFFKNIIRLFHDDKMKEFIKFGLVGVGNTLLTIIFFNMFVFFHMDYLLANMMAYCIGTLNSYFWNKNWVFEAKQAHKKVLYKFIMTNFVVLALNNFVLYFGVSILQLSPFISQLTGTAIGMVVNFFINRNWTFIEKSAG